MRAKYPTGFAPNEIAAIAAIPTKITVFMLQVVHDPFPVPERPSRPEP